MPKVDDVPTGQGKFKENFGKRGDLNIFRTEMALASDHCRV